MRKEKRAYSAHCLVITFPVHGHVNPMLQFSKRLQHKGIKVTLALTQYLYNTTAHAAGSSIAVEPFSDGYDDVQGHSHAESHGVYLTTFQTVGAQTLSDLIERLRRAGEEVDCVIYDAFMPWVLDVGRKFGLVAAAFFTQSCAVGNIYYHVYKGELKIPLAATKFVLPGLPPLEDSDVPSFVSDIESHPALLEMVVNQFCNVQKADWVLYNTVYELEKQEVDWMAELCRVRTIGPTIPSMYLDNRLPHDKEYGLSMYKPNVDSCMKWLNDRSDGSVVYVSFGSIAELEALQMEELARALKNSNYHFLWVVRDSEEAKLPNKFVDEIKSDERGLIVSWCPQLDVLSHKAIGCFVTHSGWNSTLEALSLGVAMVTMPRWSDQTTNAKYVMDVWEMGIKAEADEKGVVREDVVVGCIREVMEGERGKGIRKNAAKWREVMRVAAGEGGSSDRNIDELVANLVRV